MPEVIETTINDEKLRQEASDLLDNGEFAKAEHIIRGLLNSSPDDTALLNALGSALARKGDFPQAEKIFTQVIEIAPDYTDAHYNLGLIHNRQNRTAEAIADFLNVVKLNPSDAAANNDLGVLYYAQGKTHLAKGHFIKALETSPTYKNALLNLFEICWQEDAYDEGLRWVENFLSNAGEIPRPDNTKRETPVVRNETFTTPEHKYAKTETAGQSHNSLVFKSNSKSKNPDLFLKHVPEELKDRKNGLDIAVVADFNIAGQLSMLFKMINRYTAHKARLIVMQGDYLSYDKDIILSGDNPEDLSEAQEIIRSADFFHFGRFPKDIADINWADYLRPNNTLVQYYGSELRANAAQIYQWHKANNINGLSAWDYTMLENSPLFYHINIMCDLSRVKPCSPPEDIVRICHPSTNREIKKTELFLNVMEKLKKNYPVEYELIEGVSNDECLDIKSRCQITYDQISVGIYGLSAIESMAAGHAVLTGISNFAASYHPDNPIVHVTERNLYDRLEYLLNHKEEITRIGNAGKTWARVHHDPMKIIKQYTWFYDFVVNGHSFIEDPNRHLIS